jgi:hypothetical protein
MFVEPVVGVENEVGGRILEVGNVSLEPGQRSGPGLELVVDGLVGAGELDEPVAFDGDLLGGGLLGLADLLVDPAQGAPCPVGLVLVVDDLIGGPAGQGWVKICPSAGSVSGFSLRQAAMT